MRVIRPLESKEEIAAFVEIVKNAYPAVAIQTEEQVQTAITNFWKMQQENPAITYYGAFEETELVGGYRYHDFIMNVRNEQLNTGGIGQVAVDLLHKKEKVARDIIQKFLRLCRDKQIALATLYPFNPEFYNQMGFGFGTSIYQYRFQTAKLPQGTKAHIVRLNTTHADLLHRYYQLQVAQTPGLIARSQQFWEKTLTNASVRYYGYMQEEALSGYVSFEFQAVKDGSFLQNDILVKEFLYEHAEAFQELMAFLHSQKDQAQYTIFHLQDENFIYALHDPRSSTNILTPVYHETSRQGTGIMYRVIDAAMVFEQLHQHCFQQVSCTVRFKFHDSFTEYHNEPLIIQFNQGYPVILKQTDSYDVTVTMDIAIFSSLLMGAVNVTSLYRYGKLHLSDLKYLMQLEQLFYTPIKPQCLTMF